MWEKVKTRKHTLGNASPAWSKESEFRLDDRDAEDVEDADDDDHKNNDDGNRSSYAADNDDDDDPAKWNAWGFRVCGTVDYTLRETTGEEQKSMEWKASAEVIRRRRGLDTAGTAGGAGDGNRDKNDTMFVFSRYRVYL